MQAHIEVQASEETLLRANFESLQERESIVAQQVKEEEQQLCQGILDEELKGDIKITRRFFNRV
eukprot:6074162-Prorocentrum_lima.AAC.1